VLVARPYLKMRSTHFLSSAFLNPFCTLPAPLLRRSCRFPLQMHLVMQQHRKDIM
jgi:hypothetical protein